MTTFSLTGADGQTWNVDANTKDEAQGKVNAYYSALKTQTPAPSLVAGASSDYATGLSSAKTPQGTMPFTITGTDGKAWTVDAASKEEAQSKVDAYYKALKDKETQDNIAVIKQGLAPETPQEILQGMAKEAPYQAAAAGRAAVGGLVAIPSAVTDWVGEHLIPYINSISKPGTEMPIPNTTEASNWLLDKLGIPRGNETPGARFIGDVTGALTGQGETKLASDLLSKGAKSLAPSKTQSVLNALTADQGVQAAGNVAGTGVTSVLNENPDSNKLANEGLGVLTSILVSKGMNSWGDVEKAIANGQIKSEDRQFLLSMAQKYPLLTQAAFPIKSGVGRYLQRVSGSIPIIGTAGQVEKQAEGVQSSLQDALNATPTNTKQAAMQDLVSNRGARIGALKQQKQQILDAASVEVPVAGSVNVNPQAGPGSVFKTGKEVGPTVTQGGPDTISVDASIPGNSGTIVKPALDQIDALKAKMAGANNPAVFGSYMKRLDDLATALKNSDPNGIELNRQVLRDIYEDPQLGNVGKTLSGASRALYGAVADSLTQTIQAKLGPEAAAKWSDINKTLSSNAEDLKNMAFKSALNRGAENLNRADSLINYVENQNDYGVAKNMLKDLSPQGKLDMGDAVIMRWMQKAGLAADKDVSSINPDAMITELRKAYGPAGLFFSTEQTNQAKGLLQYLKAVQSSSSEAVTNPWHYFSGVVAIPFMRVYNTKAVRNMLIRLHDMKPTDPAFKNTIQQLNDTFQKTIGEGDQNAN